MTFHIANKLEIRRGGYILVPGCEPLSNLTSLKLLEQAPCQNTYVLLEDALEAIPDAIIEITYNPHTRWFVLPSGPPPQYGCAETDCTDWYEILRQLPPAEVSEDKVDCSPYKDSFDYFGGCKIE